VVRDVTRVPIATHRASGALPVERYEVERPAPPDRPWVLANFVAGLDGAVAVEGRVGPLTSPTDQRLFHHLRSLADAVLVGAGTVRAEGYGPARVTDEQRAARTVRGQSDLPRIAVVSASLRFDWRIPLFAAAGSRPLLVCPSATDDQASREARRHADLLVAGDDRVDLQAALRRLREQGVSTLLCEGGPALVAELLAAHLLDELCLTLAPLTGGDPLRLVAASEPQPLTRFELAHAIGHDDEVYLRYLARPRDGER
jgi:riboflavin biosynthesis pyrimidine reductase